MANRTLAALAALLGRPTPVVGATPHDVVHRENKWRLLRYRSIPAENGAPRDATSAPVLLIPSLINRHYVLDLMPGKSFAEHLVRAGHDVYCIDWGTPGPEDRYLSFDDVCDRAIARALRKVARAEGADTKVHVLGYCLGGTLAAIHAAVHPERFASLTLVAAPVRFDDDGLLARWTRTPTFDLDALLAAEGNVPWQIMQGAFHMLRPTLTLAKAVSVINKAWDDPFLDGFLALETWGSDNVSFPGEAYRTYIEELYRRNALWHDAFSLSGHRVRLSAIECPVHAVTFEHDDIVPHRSASDVLQKVASAIVEHTHLPGGHVGAMVSSSAAKRLWPKLRAFWARSAPGAPAEQRDQSLARS